MQVETVNNFLIHKIPRKIEKELSYLREEEENITKYGSLMIQIGTTDETISSLAEGYPSKNFFKYHFNLESYFLFQLPSKFNKQIDEIVNSGLKDITIELYEDLPAFRIQFFYSLKGY
jgi:hypothetical protein